MFSGNKKGGQKTATISSSLLKKNTKKPIRNGTNDVKIEARTFIPRKVRIYTETFDMCDMCGTDVRRAADGTEMATINESDDAERRWRVVAKITLDKVKGELESATRDRALQTLRDTISRNRTGWATVVRVDNVPTDYSIGVDVLEDAAGFYATETVVRRRLAATEGGTRVLRRGSDGTQKKLFNDEDCDFMRAAPLPSRCCLQSRRPPAPNQAAEGRGAGRGD